MSELDFLTSSTDQLQVLREYTALRTVLHRYDIADADELSRVLARADRLDKLVRSVRAGEGA